MPTIDRESINGRISLKVGEFRAGIAQIPIVVYFFGIFVGHTFGGK